MGVSGIVVLLNGYVSCIIFQKFSGGVCLFLRPYIDLYLSILLSLSVWEPLLRQGTRTLRICTVQLTSIKRKLEIYQGPVLQL